MSPTKNMVQKAEKEHPSEKETSRAEPNYIHLIYFITNICMQDVT